MTAGEHRAGRGEGRPAYRYREGVPTNRLTAKITRPIRRSVILRSRARTKVVRQPVMEIRPERRLVIFRF
eukprot:3890108-Prymnesium_polylepis.2